MQILPGALKRFVTKFEVDETTGCWVWTGALGQPDGYGRLYSGAPNSAPGTKAVLAHRFSFVAFVGPIPEGLDLDHLCRNRACVNPDHLEPVTRGENLRRGQGPSSRTRCPSGHAYTRENTYLRKNGNRVCRTCAIERSKENYRKKKAAARGAASAAPRATSP